MLCYDECLSDVKRKGSARRRWQHAVDLMIARYHGLTLGRNASGAPTSGRFSVLLYKDHPSEDGEDVTDFPLQMLEWVVAMWFRCKWYQSMRWSLVRRMKRMIRIKQKFRHLTCVFRVPLLKLGIASTILLLGASSPLPSLTQVLLSAPSSL